MKWEPKGYMKRAVKFLVSRNYAGLFLDPGMGKTSIVLAAFLILKKARLVKRVLVVAPLRPARSVWAGPKGEAKKWDDFQHIKIGLIHGSKRKEALRAKNDIDVVNLEGLGWLLSNVELKKWPWDWLVIDESTKFKHTNTLRFKLLAPSLTFFRRRTILTGTPAPNGLLNLFGQIYLLDLGRAFGRYISHYRMRFFSPAEKIKIMRWDHVKKGPEELEIATGWRPKAGAEKIIYKLLQDKVLRMDAADYLKMPPLIDNPIQIELPEKVRKMYDQMENAMLTAVSQHLITASNAGVRSIKCRQIANGGIYLDDHSWKNLHAAKTDAVVDLVEELDGKPVFVAYEFKHDLARLRKAFPKAPYLGGGVSGKEEQQKIEDAWNAGDTPVLLAQPQSVAHGLNIQGTRADVIWHSLTFNLEDYDQFIRRIWRQGQKTRVVNHQLIATDTVDEVIVAALRSKDRTQRALLNALRDYAERRKRSR
jgi:SNF2 family DNA or RNA helicase